MQPNKGRRQKGLVERRPKGEEKKTKSGRVVRRALQLTQDVAEDDLDEDARGDTGYEDQYGHDENDDYEGRYDEYGNVIDDEEDDVGPHNYEEDSFVDDADYPGGYDADGFDQYGYDRDGWNAWGVDPDGYGRDGLDHNGYTREEYGNYDAAVSRSARAAQEQQRQRTVGQRAPGAPASNADHRAERQRLHDSSVGRSYGGANGNADRPSQRQPSTHGGYKPDPRQPSAHAGHEDSRPQGSQRLPSTHAGHEGSRPLGARHEGHRARRFDDLGYDQHGLDRDDHTMEENRRETQRVYAETRSSPLPRVPNSKSSRAQHEVGNDDGSVEDMRAQVESLSLQRQGLDRELTHLRSTLARRAGSLSAGPQQPPRLVRDAHAPQRRRVDSDVRPDTKVGYGNAWGDGTSARRALEWAEADKTGNASRMVQRHYVPVSRRPPDTGSVSSHDSNKSRTRGIRLYDPIAIAVHEYLSRYTTHPQQRAMQSKSNASKMEINGIIRSPSGMKYGCFNRHDEVARFILSPESFTAGKPIIRDRVIELMNSNPKGYTRIRTLIHAMDPNDETTWEFPFEEIDTLHRYYCDLVTCFVVFSAVISPGENPLIPFALVFSILTANPINWAALDKPSFDPLKVTTWLEDRGNNDKWRAYDGSNPEVLTASTRNTAPRVSPPRYAPPPRRERADRRRDDRADRPPAPVLPTTGGLLAIGPPPGTPTATAATRPLNTRPPLLPDQCANCMAMGHRADVCTNPCTKGICRALPPHVRSGCTNIRK